MKAKWIFKSDAPMQGKPLEAKVAALTTEIKSVEAQRDEAYESDNQEIAQLREALKKVQTVLGPTPPNCGCQGCQEEMAEALAAVNTALTQEGR